MYKIRIKLLSDSCIASGEGYNSSIDTDVCYDSYGLPYIPAKRIKGCLRESALELRDFGLAEFNQDGKDMLVEVFGDEGYKPSALHISNAKLIGYENYISDLEMADSSYALPQTVLNQFTYIRYQTKIDEVTGTAEDTSLRAVRVMNKGLEFEAELELPSKYEKIFRMCCQNLRSMGVNRTRGMGEIMVTLVNDESDKCVQVSNVAWDDDKSYSRLSYNITLKSPALFKSVAGGQSKTVQYIDGAKILGMIAQGMGEEFADFMNKGKLICSNAYVSDGKDRYTPISASNYHIKNKKSQLRDKAYMDFAQAGLDEGVQLCQISGWFVNSDTEKTISKQTVDTELHYHHSRPDDKSKGRVAGDNDKNMSAATNSKKNGAFFQMESISAGQVFSGFVTGSKEQLKQVYDIFTAKPSQRIGYSKTSEYGDALVEITSLEEACDKAPVTKNQFVIKLNSPTIIYNENGMYSTNETELVKYVADKLNVDTGMLVVKNRFLSYRMVGGFNVTWGYKKPVLNAFDMGTTLVMETKDGEAIDVSPIMNSFIGERCSEGYGEIVCYDAPSCYEKEVVSTKLADTKVALDDYKTDLISKIATAKARDYIKKCAREVACKLNVSKKHNAVNSNLIMMCKEQPSFDLFKKNIKERFEKNTDTKSSKLEMANQIISSKLDMAGILNDAQKEHPYAKLQIDEVYKLYVMTLLTTIKYRLKEEKGNE